MAIIINCSAILSLYHPSFIFLKNSDKNEYLQLHYHSNYCITNSYSHLIIHKQPTTCLCCLATSDPVNVVLEKTRKRHQICVVTGSISSALVDCKLFLIMAVVSDHRRMMHLFPVGSSGWLNDTKLTRHTPLHNIPYTQIGLNVLC